MRIQGYDISIVTSTVQFVHFRQRVSKAIKPYGDPYRRPVLQEIHSVITYVYTGIQEVCHAS